jgi:site-specific recombinase XerD
MRGHELSRLTSLADRARIEGKKGPHALICSDVILASSDQLAVIANAGHDTRALQAWLGHKNIQHTVRYTELAPDRFKDFWR